VCIGCFQLVEVGDVFVTAPEQLGEGSAWHPQCFKCTQCKKLLVDLVYFFSEQKQSIYCGRHQAELLIPRCAACDQVSMLYCRVTYFRGFLGYLSSLENIYPQIFLQQFESILNGSLYP